MEETKKYKVVEAFELDGTSYEVDTEVELTAEQAAKVPETAITPVEAPTE